MTKIKQVKCLNASTLKILAMLLMLLDHMWGSGVANYWWMTAIGRVAFPIFAFQVAEGYAHTRNFKKYLGRMFLFALIAEVPYDLMTGGAWFDPFRQNVMFTFCISLLVIRVIDKARAKNRALGVIAAVGMAVVGYLVGTFTFVDYYGYGVWMVLAFWLFRDFSWGWIAQLAAMIYINFCMIGGLEYELLLFGKTVFFPEQGLAVLSLLPIWLYNGKQGIRSRGFQYACYAFYPVHMLILVLIAALR